ncbi:hypothetical protein RDI58_022546 [Solanum bulbocastanum]|uniref:Uncharacterized protein n=1 Tax=Solanum bulbocastanum TaxID=147425 RepID=A0AAN8T869_SOLBU
MFSWEESDFVAHAESSNIYLHLKHTFFRLPLVSTELEISSKMSAKEEAGESRAPVVYNGSASRINEIGLQLYPVSEYDSGKGLPYAHRTISSAIELQSSLSHSPVRAINLSLVFAEVVVVSSATKLLVRTMMGTVTFDVKQQ